MSFFALVLCLALILAQNAASGSRAHIAKAIPAVGWGHEFTNESPDYEDKQHSAHAKYPPVRVGKSVIPALTFFQTDIIETEEKVFHELPGGGLPPESKLDVLGLDGPMWISGLMGGRPMVFSPVMCFSAVAALVAAAAVVARAMMKPTAVEKSKPEKTTVATEAPTCAHTDDDAFLGLENLSEHEIIQMKEIAMLPRNTTDDISPARAPYDCAVFRPQEESALVRIQGRIVARGATVRAPVTGNECVTFTTTATKCREDGAQTPPASFYSAGSEFEVEIRAGARAANAEKVRVSGGQVAMTGMASGCEYSVRSLPECPAEVKDLVLGQTELNEKSNLDDTTLFEMTESFLSVGAEVTCVGKLLRAATGQLHLLPPDLSSVRELGAVQLLTSSSKVIVSDNPFLLRVQPDAM